MSHTLYQVDAFASELFAGNPAAVMVLEAWMPPSLMQAIAAENNLSETVYVVPEHNGYGIRWFTPTVEVPLCGHGTLAASHILFTELGLEQETVTFSSASGPLRVRRVAGGYQLDFPPSPVEEDTLPKDIAEVFGFQPIEVLRHEEKWLIVTDEQIVRSFDRSFLHLPGSGGVVLTAPGEGAYDCVSRFFGLRELGIEEDPVTGSMHCMVIPYWAERLGKSHLRAFQASRRGGELHCEYNGERVYMTGQAVTYLKGEILLPE